MTEPHKRPHRHPTYKTAYRLKNGRAYEQSLRARGDITWWISPDAIDAGTPPQTGKRGAQPVDADIEGSPRLSIGHGGHLNVMIVPAALAAVERRQQSVDGKTLITAIAKGMTRCT